MTNYDGLVEASARELTITIQLQKRLLFRAIFRKQITSLSGWVVPVMATAIAAVALRREPIGVVGAVFVGVAMLFIFPWSLSKASAKNPGALAPITYTFDESGVSAVYVNGETRSAWSLVVRAFETANEVFVVMQSGSFHLIPKAQVNERELAALREILQRHLGAQARRLRTT